MPNIYLSRHGESKYNTENRIGGNSNLSSNGKIYSIMIAKYINKINVDIVLTSQLIRTIETARYITHPKRIIKELNELNAGICDELTYDDIKSKYSHIHTERKNNKYYYRYPNGESYFDLLVRLKPVFDIIDGTYDTIVIIAHQAVLRIIYGKIMNIDKMEQPYISIPLHTIIHINNDKVINKINFNLSSTV